MSFRRGLLSRGKLFTIILWVLAVVVCLGVWFASRKEDATVPRSAAPAVTGMVYYVSPDGDNTRSGQEQSLPLASIQLALDRAQPGDAVRLADGAYFESIKSVRAGTAESPILITGSNKAILHGSESRIVEIRHSYLVLDGFQVDGHWGRGDSKEDFRDKLIYVISSEPKKGVEGLKLTNLLLQNAGGECVRLRYFAKNNEISHSTIRNCGIYDFRFSDGGKNGEGIYIGTAPEQLADGKNPSVDPDESSGNQIHHNSIETNGNECVDIKEAAVNNIVEYNTCENQLDPESGGFDSRGNQNVFRFNTVRNTKGAAVRLGGDGEQDGIRNDVYGNVFVNNEDGLLNIQREPQGKVCGNEADYQDNPNSDDDNIDPTKACS